MDPQHRMLLEVCYEASESAGITLSDLSGSDTAVFVGLMSYDYSGIASRDANFIPVGIEGAHYFLYRTFSSHSRSMSQIHTHCQIGS
jgi:acyl transferase domain-containing protein